MAAFDLFLVSLCGFLILERQLVSSMRVTDVRLTGGPTPNEGTVEYIVDTLPDTWQTTCGTNLGIHDAIAICGSLGFPGANKAITMSLFSSSSSPGATPMTLLDCQSGDSLPECPVSSTINQCPSGPGGVNCYNKGYLGCFEDKVNERVLTGTSAVGRSDMSIQTCLDICRGSGDGATPPYTYAGIENGNECFCGAAGSDFTRHGTGSDRDCQHECTGKTRESCGGSGFIAIIDIQQYTMPEQLTTMLSLPTMVTNVPDTSRRASPPIRSTQTTILNNSPQRNNAGVYGGAIGGILGVVLLIVVIVIIVLLVKRSRRSPGMPKHQDGLALKEKTLGNEAGANGKGENTYEGIYHDVSDETVIINTKQSHNSSQNGGTTAGQNGVAENPKDSLDALYAMPDEKRGTNEDFSAMYAAPDKTKRHKSEEEDFSALYAQPDKSGKISKEENFEDLYAHPDKNRKSGIEMPATSIEDMYAMPDKSRKATDQSRDGPEVHSSDVEGLYSSVQDGSEGLYAISSSEIPNGSTGEIDGTVMVENELYTL